MMNKKKILIVLQHFRRGGVELAALNFALNLDESKYDLTFLLLGPFEEHDKQLEQEIIGKSFKIIKLSPDEAGYIKRYKKIKSIISENNYDIVHSHVMFASGFVMLAAAKYGVKIRASHSHATKWNRKENFQFKIYRFVMQAIINKYATHKLACSNDAGIYMFGEKEFLKDGIVIPNGVNMKKFAFDNDVKKAKRQELNIGENTFLVGHIGTIYRIKNQTFLVDVFDEILKIHPDSKLILVGEKDSPQPVEEKIKELKIEEKVIMTGPRTDISELLCAMDIMIFPSLHEALPVSLIEAQASKLPCLISDTVTPDVKYNDNVCFMPLTEKTSLWAQKACELSEIPREDTDIGNLKNNYSIDVAVKKLDAIYCS
ncbi:MAG: glycosyltransferase family 1 protein [Eubacterium sp.]